MNVFTRSRILKISYNRYVRTTVVFLLFLFAAILDIMHNRNRSTVQQKRRNDAPFLLVRFNGTYLSNNYMVRYQYVCKEETFEFNSSIWWHWSTMPQILENILILMQTINFNVDKIDYIRMDSDVLTLLSSILNLFINLP